MVWLLAMTGVQAQSGAKISGTITLSNATPAEGATVVLLRLKDSTLLKRTLARKDGSYVFEEVPQGSYRVAATSSGHRKSFSEKLELSGQQTVQVPPLQLTAANNELTNVTVTAKRPLIEQKIDRTIVNVEAAITNAGASALEVLEKSPGVSVDRDGNISLKGKEGVMILLDGRPTQLAGADLAALLRNLNANQLDQIEIMTNPPAKYDAAGTSGIINLKTKKTNTVGMNGSANLAYSQGRYPKTTEAVNFNYRENKTNVFANLGHNYQKRFSTLSIDRNIFTNGTNRLDKIFNQEANRVNEGNSYNAKLGADFFASSKTTLGAVVNLTSRNQSANNPNTTRISNAAKDLESITNARVTNETNWNSVNTTVNFRTLLDKKGKELTADVDLAKHTMQNNLFMVNSYRNAAGLLYAKADTLTGDLPQRIDVYSARLDYVHPFKKEARWEAGLKTSVVRTDNNAAYDSLQNGTLVRDAARSNHFVYEETIHAAYANLSTPLSKKWTAQLGLRIENTSATGRQLTTGETFQRQYTQFFPTAYFQYKANAKNILSANLGRRVSRPGYAALNPFIRFLDRYTFSQGNPELKPSVSTNIEVSHSWKVQITTTINYTHVNDIIQEVIQQKGQEAYNRPANVSSLQQVGLAVNASNRIGKWWLSNINLNVYNDNYKGIVSNTAINRQATSYVFSSTQQFKISKTLMAELNGRYRNGWLEGIMRVSPVGFVGAGLSQQVLKNKGTIRLTARDIFWTQKIKGVTQYGNVDAVVRQVSETQVFTLSFSYSFSKGKKLPPVKRTEGSAAEEQSRIGQ